jgi:excisionase family DNA binding protein
MSTTTTSADAERLITTEQVAERLGLGAITVKRMVKRGDLPCLRFNNSVVRFRLSDVEQFLRSLEAKQS